MQNTTNLSKIQLSHVVPQNRWFTKKKAKQRTHDGNCWFPNMVTKYPQFEWFTGTLIWSHCQSYKLRCRNQSSATTRGRILIFWTFYLHIHQIKADEVGFLASKSVSGLHGNDLETTVRLAVILILEPNKSRYSSPYLFSLLLNIVFSIVVGCYTPLLAGSYWPIAM